MTDQKQHKVVYNVPTEGDKFVRVEVLAPLGMSAETCRIAVANYLRANPRAMLLSRTWSDRDL